MQKQDNLSGLRGKPAPQVYACTRDVLIRSGMALLTEQGFTATGLDAVLKRAAISKGSFYHYFDSKHAFVVAVMDAYDDYFKRKLDRCLRNRARAPLDRLSDFVVDAAKGMRRHRFTRGCLVGNLGQELGVLPSGFRERLNTILVGWQAQVASCLQAAQTVGHIAAYFNPQQLAEFFWIAWEGAVLRARLMQSDSPLFNFMQSFLLMLGVVRPQLGRAERTVP